MRETARGANLPRLGEFNQAVVVDAIRRSGDGLTRAQLARRTGLSPQTVTNITRRLIAEGLATESGDRGRPGPGRRGTILKLVPGGGYAFGISIDPAVVSIVLLDLGATRIAQASWPSPISGRPEDLVAELADRVTELAGAIDPKRVVGIGISSPGPIDFANGVILDPPLLPLWHNVALREAVARATGFPTVIDKDGNAAMASQLWQPAGAASDAVMFCYIGAGVAVSVAYDNSIVRGPSGNAGESGHLVVDPSGPECGCGRRGCLGVLLGLDAFVRAGAARGIPGLADVDHRSFQALDAAFSALCDTAAAGSAAAQDILARAGHHAAMATTMLCDLLDLDTLVIGGPSWNRMSRYALPALLSEIGEHALPRGGVSVRVHESPFGREVAAVGAASLALGNTFAPRVGKLLLG